MNTAFNRSQSNVLGLTTQLAQLAANVKFGIEKGFSAVPIRGDTPAQESVSAEEFCKDLGELDLAICRLFIASVSCKDEDKIKSAIKELE